MNCSNRLSLLDHAEETREGGRKGEKKEMRKERKGRRRKEEERKKEEGRWEAFWIQDDNDKGKVMEGDKRK